MAFSDYFALAVACGFGVLALNLGDNEWAKSHLWLIPVLWTSCAVSLLFALFHTRWFRGLFTSKEAVNQETSRQEVSNSSVGGDVRQAGRDYYETHDSHLHSQVSQRPVIHFEPDFGSIESKAGPGTFIVLMSNTGADAEKLRLFTVYFVAQRLDNKVVLKEVAHGSANPAVTLLELTRTNSPVPIRLEFGTLLPIMTEVAANGKVSYLFGVKLHVIARRQSDGRDFDFHHCYRISPDGNWLLCPRQTVGGMASSVVNVLELEDVVPHLNSPEHWSSVVTNITSVNGLLARRNT